MSEKRSRSDAREKNRMNAPGTTLAIVLGAAALTAAAQDTMPRPGPFDVIEWADGVRTSRSGYAIWVSLVSAEHQARLPGHETKVSNTDPPPHHAVLEFKCRAAEPPHAPASERQRQAAGSGKDQRSCTRQLFADHAVRVPVTHVSVCGMRSVAGRRRLPGPATRRPVRRRRET